MAFAPTCLVCFICVELTGLLGSILSSGRPFGVRGFSARRELLNSIAGWFRSAIFRVKSTTGVYFFDLIRI